MSLALTQVPLSRFGLIILLQPILVTVLGVWVLNEHLTTTQIFGVVILLIGVALGSQST